MMLGDIPAVMMQTTPTHASHDMFPKVCTLEKAKPAIAAIATKTAVQVACVDTALRAIDKLSIAEPETKIKTADCQSLIITDAI